MRVLSLRLAAAMSIFVGLVSAQQTGTTTAPTTGGTTTAPAPTTGGGNTTPTGTTVPRGQTPTQSSQPTRPPQPIFISGNVTLPDGTEPPERVLIERVCSMNRVRSEGYTDSKGRFSFQLGQNQQVLPDASEAYFNDGTQGFGGTGNSNSSTTSSTGDPLLDCELRARLPGFRSSTVMLAGHRSMDNPNIGTLVVYPMNGEEGQAISATGANASKQARKAFEKGSELLRKAKLEDAEKELRKAVDLHPKYAEAWLALGKTYARRQRYDAAKVALRQAIAADPKFVYPYEELYKVAFDQTDWEELADATSKLVKLNPYEFPDAYYYNGVAQYQLKNWDLAAKSLDQAMEAGKRKLNPKVLYVMGLVMVQKHDYARAFETLTDFVEMSPNDPTIPKVKTMLAQLEKMQ